MKALSARTVAAAALFMAVAAPFAAHADGYLTNYGGGGYGGYNANYLSGHYGYGGYNGNYQLSTYGSGSYSPGFGGGYSNVAYGYNSANSSPDTPHRSTWAEYTQLRAEYQANLESQPLCGSYDRNPLECKQGTQRWNPLANQ